MVSRIVLVGLLLIAVAFVATASSADPVPTAIPPLVGGKPKLGLAFAAARLKTKAAQAKIKLSRNERLQALIKTGDKLAGARIRVPWLHDGKQGTDIVIAASLRYAGATDFKAEFALVHPNPWVGVLGFPALAIKDLAGSVVMSPTAAASYGVKSVEWSAKMHILSLKSKQPVEIDTVGYVNLERVDQICFFATLSNVRVSDIMQLALPGYGQAIPDILDFSIADKIDVYFASPTLGAEFTVLGKTFTAGLRAKLDNFDFLGLKMDLSISSTVSHLLPEFWMNAAFKLGQGIVVELVNRLVKLLTSTFPEQIAKTVSVFVADFKALFPLEHVHLTPFGIKGSVVQLPSLQLTFKSGSWIHNMLGSNVISLPKLAINIDWIALGLNMVENLMSKITGNMMSTWVSEKLEVIKRMCLKGAVDAIEGVQSIDEKYLNGILKDTAQVTAVVVAAPIAIASIVVDKSLSIPGAVISSAARTTWEGTEMANKAVTEQMGVAGAPINLAITVGGAGVAGVTFLAGGLLEGTGFVAGKLNPFSWFSLVEGAQSEFNNGNLFAVAEGRVNSRAMTNTDNVAVSVQRLTAREGMVAAIESIQTEVMKINGAKQLGQVDILRIESELKTERK